MIAILIAYGCSSDNKIASTWYLQISPLHILSNSLGLEEPQIKDLFYGYMDHKTWRAEYYDGKES